MTALREVTPADAFEARHRAGEPDRMKRMARAMRDERDPLLRLTRRPELVPDLDDAFRRLYDIDRARPLDPWEGECVEVPPPFVIVPTAHKALPRWLVAEEADPADVARLTAEGLRADQVAARLGVVLATVAATAARHDIALLPGWSTQRVHPLPTYTAPVEQTPATGHTPAPSEGAAAFSATHPGRTGGAKPAVALAGEGAAVPPASASLTPAGRSSRARPAFSGSLSAPSDLAGAR